MTLSDMLLFLKTAALQAVTEFSLADRVERRVESPLQKFARLRAEVEELRGDLEIISKEDAEAGMIMLSFS